MNTLATIVPSLDPVLRTSIAIAAAVLAGAGLLLLVVGRWTDTSSMWRTYRGWLRIFPFVLVALLGGRTTTILGVALVAAMGFREYARATGLDDDRRMVRGVQLGLAGVLAATWMTDPRLDQPGWYGMFMALPVFVVVGLSSLQILGERREHRFTRLCLAILGFVYFAWMFGHLGFLANAENFYGYVFFLVFSIEVCDVAAFVFGKLFGRHKLCPQISPRKTWEGALGAFAVAMALPWVLRFALPELTTVALLLAGLIVGVGGPLGDLTVSLIKRELGIKDMGNLIPGHGGVLDRIDSLVLAAPLFFHMVRWFHGIY